MRTTIQQLAEFLTACRTEILLFSLNIFILLSEFYFFRPSGKYRTILQLSERITDQ